MRGCVDRGFLSSALNLFVIIHPHTFPPLLLSLFFVLARWGRCAGHMPPPLPLCIDAVLATRLSSLAGRVPVPALARPLARSSAAPFCRPFVRLPSRPSLRPSVRQTFASFEL